MTSEGILARGKANHDAGKFLDNIETLAYVATLPKDKPVEEKPVEEKPVEEKPVEEKPVEEKPKEVKDGKPKPRRALS